jgi:peptide/nickel transport system substrate-binding protein
MIQKLLRRLAIIATAAMAATIGVAAVPASAATTLNIGLPSDPAPTSFDPHDFLDGQRLFFESLYDSLFYPDGKGGYTKGLALTGKQPTSTSLVMVIRENATFSDGTKVTGAVVKANLDLRNTKKDGKAIVALNKFATGETNEITNVEANGQTVTVTFKKATANAALLFTSTSGMIVSGSAAANVPSLNAAPAGSGPYQLVASKTVKGTTYTVAQNKSHWRADQYGFSTIVYKVYTNAQSFANAIVAKQVDVAPQPDAKVLSFLKSKKAPYNVVGGKVSGIIFFDKTGTTVARVKNPGMEDKNVRLALSYATDRVAYTNAINKGGRPTANFSPKGDAGFDAALDTKYTYNLAKAKQLLAAAGYPALTLSMVVSPAAQDRALVLKAQWAKAGVTLNVKVTTQTSEIFGAVATQPLGTYDDTTSNGAGAANTIVNAFYNLQKATNTAIETALVSANAGTKGAEKSLNQALVNEGWIIPIVELQDYTFYNAAKVKKPGAGKDGTVVPSLFEIAAK